MITTATVNQATIYHWEVERGWVEAASPTRLYFVRRNGGVQARAYDYDGGRQQDDDIDLSGGATNWTGGLTTSTRLYFVGSISNTAVAYDYDGNRQVADDLSLGSGQWTGGLATPYTFILCRSVR